MSDVLHVELGCVVLTLLWYHLVPRYHLYSCPLDALAGLLGFDFAMVSKTFVFTGSVGVY